MDLLDAPACAVRRRIPHRIRLPPLTSKSLGRLFRGLLVSAVISVACLAAFCVVGVRCSLLDVHGAVPHPRVWVTHIAAAALCEDFAFYAGHRLLHSPRLFRWVHRVHHEFVTPVAIEAAYGHPVEVLFAHLTWMAQPLILRSHITVTVAWFVLATIMTLVCGDSRAVDAHCA